jgi:hypothetical protein
MMTRIPSPPRDSPNTRRVLVVIALTILVGAGVAFFIRPTIEQIEDRTRVALPRGTSLKKIDDYFTAQGIEHSLDQSGNRVYAIVPLLRGSFPPVQWDAQIILFLDRNDTLDTIEVRRIGTGP